MATRSSARIIAAKARSRTGNAKSTRSSDRIAKMNQSSGIKSESTRLQQATKGGLAKNPSSRPLRSKKPGSTRVPRAGGEDEQRIQDANEANPPAAVLNGPDQRMPAYYGGPQIAFPWNGSAVFTRRPSDEELSDYNDQGEDDVPDEGDAYPNRPTEEDNEGPFLQTLFRSVTTQRALRRKREELRTCHQDIRDAEFMEEQYQNAMTFRNPTTDAECNMHNSILGKVAEWETELSGQQDLETGISHQIKCLESRAEKQCTRNQYFPRLSQESQRLHFLSNNHDFWESFNKWQATSKSLGEIDRDLGQSKAVKDALDIEIDLGCMRNLDLAANDPSSFSVAREEVAYQDVSKAHGLYQKHEELEHKEQSARKVKTEQWMHLLRLAEDAFVQAGVLEVAKGRKEGEEPEPEPEPVQKPGSEVMKDGVRERL